MSHSPAPDQPHRIHLRGPWEYEWVTPRAAADAHSGPWQRATAGRVKLPARWQLLFGNAPGTVRFRRRFHRPTRLEAHERVIVAFDGIGGTARIYLNLQQLDSHSALGKPAMVAGRTQQALRYDITALLKPANELAIEIEFDPSQAGDAPGGLWAPVAIEVWSTAAATDSSSAVP